MNIAQKAAETLDVTKDAALGYPVVTVVGNCSINIENFKSIVEYDCGQAKILTKKGVITICGKKLEIVYYDNEEIQIKGIICSIVF